MGLARQAGNEAVPAPMTGFDEARPLRIVAELVHGVAVLLDLRVRDAPFPDAETEQPQSVQVAADEMELGVGQLAGRRVPFVAMDLDGDLHGISFVDSNVLI